MPLHDSNPSVHLQEDGCAYRYDLFACNGISSLQTTRLLMPLHVNILNHACSYNRLPEDELSSSKHVEDIVKIKVLV
jgi:hypothetical protein